VSSTSINAADLAEIAEHGLLAGEAERQLALYADPPGPAVLARPCVAGDGIRRLEQPEIDRYLSVYEDALKRRSILKFIPASGAASRMFKSALACYHADDPLPLAAVRQAADGGDAAAVEVREAIEEIERFAFYSALTASMRDSGKELRSVIDGGDLRELLSALLTNEGLAYADLPKGLLAFHRYSDGARTSFEEHLVEAAGYACCGDGVCHLQFTVSDSHRTLFEDLFARVRDHYERVHGVRFDVSFSLQKPSTDVVAVTPDGELFRTEEGALLFRPGGHGALIENLADLDADVVFIKNIDNVVPDHLKEPTYLWKRVLGGVLADLQSRAFGLLGRLEANGGDVEAVDAALAFLTDELDVPVPRDVSVAAAEVRREFACKMLDRPMRVCGMVRNEGEPGGGPFWVAAHGSESVQIVESSQVDGGSDEQQAIFDGGTHFNPVDLVCGLRDRNGRPYDLHEYIDDATAFVVEKSSGSSLLRSLERPGLWNGAMAFWNTVFVEVPPETFNPVKTINDLLRPSHQPI